MPEPPAMTRAEVLAELTAHFTALGPEWEDEEGVPQWPRWQRLLAAVAGWCVVEAGHVYPYHRVTWDREWKQAMGCAHCGQRRADEEGGT